MPVALQGIHCAGKAEWTLEGFAFVSLPSMQEVRPFPPRFCILNLPKQPLTANPGLSSLVTASGEEERRREGLGTACLRPQGQRRLPAPGKGTVQRIAVAPQGITGPSG
jgi:hypothetical protein